MNKRFAKKVCLYFCSVLFLSLIYSQVTSKNDNNLGKNLYAPVASVTPFHKKTPELFSVYDSLTPGILGLSKSAFEKAIKGYAYLVERGKIANQRIISIADFSLPSTAKRLFVIDLDRKKILFNTYVAHGQNTGREFAKNFSNVENSYQSSPGFYVTSSLYNGKNGLSLKLTGMERGINDLAEQRAIVMHGAPYVCESFIKANGYLGRSWGCPAVPEQLNKPIVEKIKNGSCLFIYSEQGNYLQRSKILNA